MNDSISIACCPICFQHHMYGLQVQRDYVCEMITMESMSRPSRKVTFTRLFTCPVKGTTFQGKITLTEDPSTKIRSVEVLGPTEE